jgi:hypothetical protein
MNFWNNVFGLQNFIDELQNVMSADDRKKIFINIVVSIYYQ